MSKYNKMAVTKKKAKAKTEKRNDLKGYKLKRDYPTSKGVKKANTTIYLTLKGKEILTKQNYL